MGSPNPKSFDSKITLLNKFSVESQIKNEPMFFNCTPKFAHFNGGPITRAFLEALPNSWWENSVFDSRVHMLMPGWFPAIPGYHHDDVPRPEIPVGQHFVTAGQPDYENPKYRSEHIMALVRADICPTEFVIGQCNMMGVPDDGLIYRQWDAEIKELIANGSVSVVQCPESQLVHFDCDCFHTGTKAVKNGWRWFGRISRNTDRANKITNEIRVNAQVYLEFPMEGW